MFNNVHLLPQMKVRQSSLSGVTQDPDSFLPLNFEY